MAPRVAIRHLQAVLVAPEESGEAMSDNRHLLWDEAMEMAKEIHAQWDREHPAMPPEPEDWESLIARGIIQGFDTATGLRPRKRAEGK